MWYTLLVFVALVWNGQCRIGFMKDQRIDHIEFPPQVLKQFESAIPVGHLRPLGWQRRPEGRVAQERFMLTPEQFYDRYVKHKKPVAFRNALKDVPAISLWDKDADLKSLYGDLDVHIVVKKELFTKGPKKVTLKKFLQEYAYEDWYLSNIVPREMMKDLVIPKCLKCGMSKYFQESELWMSSGGTTSLIHSHADHNLHCVFAGRKDFILVSPENRKVLRYQPKSHPDEGYSKVDTDMINMFENPDISSVPWTWSTLKSGDCIFVPAGYLHQVRSYGRSISATILWAPTPTVDFSECDQAQIEEVTPLTEAEFIWTYVNADRQLTNVHLDADSLHHHLTVLMREDDMLKKEQFQEFFDEIMSEIENHDTFESVWGTLTGGKNLTRSYLDEIDDRTMNIVAESLNKPHTHHDEL